MGSVAVPPSAGGSPTRALAKQTLPLVVGGEAVGVVLSVASGAGREKSLERLRDAVERLGRTSALYGGLHLLTQRERGSAWVALCSALLQYAMQPFSWHLSLYFLCRAAAGAARKHLRAPHLHPLAVFFSHCLHNDLLVNRAEWVEPSYLKLWLRMMPGMSLRSWLAQFSSTERECYEPEQVGPERFARIPGAVLESFRRQLPFVAALYAVPHLVFYKATTRAHLGSARAAARFLAEQFVRVLRTSFVLGLLPFILTEFPCVLDRVAGGGARRCKLLHVLVASTASTAVFLLEPEPRLNQMVAYTYWRVLEAYMRRATTTLQLQSQGGLRVQVPPPQQHAHQQQLLHETPEQQPAPRDDKAEELSRQRWLAAALLGLAAATAAL
jgi:hypothetical protein